MTPPQNSSPQDSSSDEDIGIAFHIGSTPLELAGWAVHKDPARTQEDILVRLMMGDVMIGRLRRDRKRPDVDAHLGAKHPACGFTIPDFGLHAFVELCKVQDVALSVDSATAGTARHQLPAPLPNEVNSTPLGARNGVSGSLRLGDVWLGSARDLHLRFDGHEQVAKTLDVYQCTGTGENLLVKIAADQLIGGFISITTVQLFNPFLPVLFVYKGEDGAIDALDVLPFPSLVRGGLHAAERLMIGDGGDDLRDTAIVSARLLRAMLARTDRPDRVASIILDDTVHTGLEPMLKPDLFAWVSAFMGVTVELAKSDDVPDFILETVSKFAPTQLRAGHRLSLPANSIPTISALVEPLVGSARGSQRLTGAMGVIDRDRLGRAWSVWQPPLGDWLDNLQVASRIQALPMLEVVPGSAPPDQPQVVPSWPLSLALREKPTRIVDQSPFEISREIDVPLLRGGISPSDAKLSVIIICERNNQDITALLESLVRQTGVTDLALILLLPPGKVSPQVSDFLTSHFADRHVVIDQPVGPGKLERIDMIRDNIATDAILVLDGDVLLPDPRTLLTLFTMLDGPNVETVGCMLRSGEGKTAAQAAGYCPTGFDVRAIPSLSFATIDPAVFYQPATFPVIANFLAVLLTTKAVVDKLNVRASTNVRPEIDDLMLGLKVIEGGGLNLCTTIVSAFTAKGLMRPTDIGVSVPYRLTLDVMAQVMSSTTIVQALQ